MTDELMLELLPELKSGLIYYDYEYDRILHLTKNCRVYFKENSFWKLFKDDGLEVRKINSLLECKEIMNQHGYEFIGEL